MKTSSIKIKSLLGFSFCLKGKSPYEILKLLLLELGESNYKIYFDLERVHPVVIAETEYCLITFPYSETLTRDSASKENEFKFEYSSLFLTSKKKRRGPYKGTVAFTVKDNELQDVALLAKIFNLIKEGI